MRQLAMLGAKPRVPEKIYVTKPVIPEEKEFLPYLRKIFKTRWLTNEGNFVKEFESTLRGFFKMKYCPVFCNGTMALDLASRVLGLKGEVITTPFTFAATPHVLSWNNIKPVFCDIDPDTYNINPEAIESLVTSKTSAILPVHVFGNPCAVDKIDKIAKEKGLKVLYDAAHAFGVSINGKSIASYGNASIFSFHATKLFNTLEGGAVACDNIDIDRRLRDMRNFGIRSEEEVVSPGINAKMNEIQAVFGLLNIKKLAKGIEKRKVIYNRYITSLGSIPGLRFQKIVTAGTEYNYAYFTIQVIDEDFGLNRDEVYLAMRKEGIMARKYFWPLCSNYSCYRGLESSKKELLPKANLVSGRIISLPLFEELSYEEQDRIIETILLLQKNADKVRSVLSKNQ